jgi:transketolase
MSLTDRIPGISKHTAADNDELRARALWVWRETLVVHRRAPETRVASSLSAVELFTALFYGGILRQFPSDRYHPDRDRMIVSKGHGSICLYPILADLGFFPHEELLRVCHKGGILGGIPDPIIPGYETVNGSLGHGLGVASGIALALKGKNSDASVFVMTGDGELHEGACWEAVMFAGHHGLDQLNLIVDDNSTAMLDHTDNILSHGDLSARLASFGWAVDRVDGHDVVEVQARLAAMKSKRDGQPKALIARTVKGHKVPGLENQPLAHILAPSASVLDALLEKPL